MSGGFWNYRNGDLASEIFGWHMNCHYGKEGFNQASIARRNNPLGDREISELTWDLLCLLHSYDYYNSGDIGKDTYEKDLKYFKKKWFNRTNEDKLSAYKKDLELYAKELIKEMR